jgi:NAD-dependent deacetylase
MKKLVIFSGSGMSAESGISTFRDGGGLWDQNRIEEVATPEAWKRNPNFVQEFYNLRRKQIIDCQPNKAHIMIAELEDLFDVAVITQNIDDLHERAGSSNVLHLHGNIRQSKSSGPNSENVYFPIEGWELKTTDYCPDGFVLRPHVVWFGEDVPMYDIAVQQVALADILVVIGTSLQVYPAAGLINYATNADVRYLIDPNAVELNVPKSFRVLPLNAVEGMIQLMKELG